jgi:carboxypeptidase Taq
LEKVIELNLEKAQVLDPNQAAYDALLDTFEEGLTAQKMSQIFEAIVPVTREIIQKYQGRPEPKLSKHVFDRNKQRAFSRFLLEEIGYDFAQGNISEVVHPFMIRLGSKDCRVTNTYYENNLSSIFSALHEGGHALFEQGISQDYADLLTDDERSLGLHESQSRFWENVLGKSEAFWQKYYPRLQIDFGLTESMEDFLAYLNFVQPSPIRIEADEVTYNLHIFIRFELEKLLVSGKLKAKDVPEAWNTKYQELLGIRPKSDAEGCLQDVHWSHATLGYFPTYTLGNVISAQLWQTYQTQNSDWSATLTDGHWSKILGWYRQNVHEFGPLHTSEEILQQVTGEELNPQHFVGYLREKYLG